MFHSCIDRTDRAYQPDEIAALKAAFQRACDRWDLDEPLTDARRNQIAVTILVSARAGFSDRETLATIALDNCRISDAADASQIALLNAYRPTGELHA